MSSLDGRIALVTGAGGGIGAATCCRLAEQSEVRVSGPLHRDHYRAGPVFFSAGSATQLATRHLQSFQEPPFVRYQRTFELSAE